MKANRHRRHWTTATASALLLALSGAVSAQTTVVTARVGTGQVELYEATATDSGFSGVSLLGTVPGRLTVGPSVTHDGRYVVLAVSPAAGMSGSLTILDRVTGVVLVGPVLRGTIHIDPSRLRLYSTYQEGLGYFLIRVDASGEISGLHGTVKGLSLAAVSGDGARLYVAEQGPAPSSEVVLTVRDSDDGTLLSSVLLPEEARRGPVAVSDDERHLFVVTGYLSNPTVRKLEAQTGAELGHLTLPDPRGVITAMAIDSERQRLVVSVLDTTLGFPGRLWTIDTLGMAQVAEVPTLGVPDGHVDIRAGRTVASASTFVQRQSPVSPTFYIASTETGLVSATQTVEPAFGSYPIAIALRPSAPVLEPPSVTDHTVTLTWAAPGFSTEAIVEAGSAPGLSNLAVLPVAGGQTTVTVPNVPAGTYYVRVRALNYVGASAPSNEVMVVVP